MKPLPMLAAGLLLLAACDSFPTACSDELVLEIRPAERTLAVGQSFRPEAVEVACGGRKSSAYPVAWRSTDPAVARVDHETGQVVGVAPGTAAVRAHEPTVSADWSYGEVLVRVVPAP